MKLKNLSIATIYLDDPPSFEGGDPLAKALSWCVDNGIRPADIERVLYLPDLGPDRIPQHMDGLKEFRTALRDYYIRFGK